MQIKKYYYMEKLSTRFLLDRIVIEFYFPCADISVASSPKFELVNTLCFFKNLSRNALINKS